MFTPSSTASTGAAPPAAARGQHEGGGQVVDQIRQHGCDHRQREQLRNPLPVGTTPASASPSPLSSTARTTTPSASTKARNGRFVAAATRAGWSTAAAAPPARPRLPLPPRSAPGRVRGHDETRQGHASTATATRGMCDCVRRIPVRPTAREIAGEEPTEDDVLDGDVATLGSAISARTGRRIDRGECQQVRQVRHGQQQRRRVREVGARVHMRSRGSREPARQSRTTGVSSTTVASRLSATVVTEARPNTPRQQPHR